MKAILIKDDERRSLIWTNVPDPCIGSDEILIEIHAAALNRADLMQRAGDYPPPEGCPEWMGLEVSGVVVAIGDVAESESQWKIGDKVCALLGGGGYAEYVAVRYDMAMPVPSNCSMIQAAAIPEAFATSYLNLFIEGNAKDGETLLMNAGASGLASVLIPMAKAFGLRVITTVLTQKIADSLGHLNADRVIVTEKESIADVMKRELAAGHGVDIAIDCLGGPAVSECLPYMERDGRWIIIATLAGDEALIDMKLMYKHSLRIIGNTLRARTPAMKARILSALVRDVWPKVVRGEVMPTIYKTFPIEQAEEAQAILQRGENVGKVVLVVKEE